LKVPRSPTTAGRSYPACRGLKPTRDVTLSAWNRTTTLDTNGAEVVSGGDHYLLRVGGATTIEFAKRVSNNMGGGTWVQCYAAVTGATDGNWHHIAGVNSAAGMKVYMDGVERCTDTEARDILYDLPDRHGLLGGPPRHRRRAVGLRGQHRRGPRLRPRPLRDRDRRPRRRRRQLSPEAPIRDAGSNALYRRGGGPVQITV
jgi:hypothetical protein